MEFCPVCMLRKALVDGVESGESSASEDMDTPTVTIRNGTITIFTEGVFTNPNFNFSNITINNIVFYTLIGANRPLPVVPLLSCALRRQKIGDYLSWVEDTYPGLVDKHCTRGKLPASCGGDFWKTGFF
jgi:hypothetical protein